MKGLLSGYLRFREERWPEEADDYAALKDVQRPRVMVISCSDSRVDPMSIFDVRPGEMFVVRNIANVVPPYQVEDGPRGTSAALEFAVKVLGVKTILILGHSGCGGCKAALEGAPDEASEFVGPWIRVLEPAKAALPETGDRLTAMERAGVVVSLNNLMTFPFISERVAAGTLELEGARFAIGDGVLERYDPETGAFSVIPPRDA